MAHKFIYKLVRFSGLPIVFRNAFQKNSVSIILYHDICPALFRKHIQLLKKFYNIIGLQDYILYRSDNKIRLPKKSLIITFDDGHKNNYKLLPILKKYKIPITIFLSSDIIDTKKQFWFLFAIQKGLDVQGIKKMEDNERIKYLKKNNFEENKEFESRESMTYKEIREMSPYVDFQSHTKSHPILTKCDSIKAFEEIKMSKEMLEKILKKEVNSIAYPNGDYSDREIGYCVKAGYKAAITLDCGFNDRKNNLFKLRRLDLNDNADVNELIAKTSGCWCFIRKLLRTFQ